MIDFRVSAPQGISHIVNLEKGTCTCIHFQDRKLPCRHVCQVCREHNLEPENYASRIYTVDTYRAVYTDVYAMPPIRLQDLGDHPQCLAPQVQKRKGRPRKKRLRKEALKPGKRPKHCRVCQSTEHDRRRCDYSGPSTSPSQVPQLQSASRRINLERRSSSPASIEPTSPSIFSEWYGFSDEDTNQPEEFDVPRDPTTFTNNNPSPPSEVLPVEPFSHNSTSLTPDDVLPPNHISYDDNRDSQKSSPSLSPIPEDFDDDELPPRTRTPTPQSEYSDGEERLSIKMARWILTEDPNLTEAKEGYRLFPERPEFKQMVDRRNHQKFHETEEWARSALQQRRNLLRICSHRLTPEQILQVEEEIYPERPVKVSAKRLATFSRVPSFSILAPRTSKPVPVEEIIRPMIEKQKKRLEKFLSKSGQIPQVMTAKANTTSQVCYNEASPFVMEYLI